MKICSYCGWQNENGEDCSQCGGELDDKPVLPIEKNIIPRLMIRRWRSSTTLSSGFFETSSPIDLSQIKMDYCFEDGFSRPDWKSIKKRVQEVFPKDIQPQAWREIGLKWMEQLSDDLGGNYNCHKSWNFFLVSAGLQKTCETLLETAEDATREITSSLGFVPKPGHLYGKKVILVLDEWDDYYPYISHFYEEGHHGGSSGVFIKKDYQHIVVKSSDPFQTRKTLIHD